MQPFEVETTNEFIIINYQGKSFQGTFVELLFILIAWHDDLITFQGWSLGKLFKVPWELMFELMAQIWTNTNLFGRNQVHIGLQSAVSCLAVRMLLEIQILQDKMQFYQDGFFKKFLITKYFPVAFSLLFSLFWDSVYSRFSCESIHMQWDKFGLDSSTCLPSLCIFIVAMSGLFLPHTPSIVRIFKGGWCHQGCHSSPLPSEKETALKCRHIARAL